MHLQPFILLAPPLLSGCTQVDCIWPHQLDRVAFSTEDRSVWLTGIEAGFGARWCESAIPRTDLVLTADADPEVTTYDWDVDDEVPEIPDSYDNAFRGGFLDCAGCVLDIPATEGAANELDGWSVRVTITYDSFEVQLVDDVGSVVGEGRI